MKNSQVYWWKGKHGEWLVVIQVILMIYVFIGPRPPRLLLFPEPYHQIPFFTGAALLISGLLLITFSIFRLGKHLTPIPYPKKEGELITSGPYKYMRHPMYTAGILMCIGWTLIVNNILTLIFSLVLILFLDYKSRREEKWLLEKYTDYKAYKEHVSRFIPFIY